MRTPLLSRQNARPASEILGLEQGRLVQGGGRRVPPARPGPRVLLVRSPHRRHQAAGEDGRPEWEGGVPAPQAAPTEDGGLASIICTSPGLLGFVPLDMENKGSSGKHPCFKFTYLGAENSKHSSL